MCIVCAYHGGMSQIRYFFRCPDCLGVWAADVEIPGCGGSPWARSAVEREAIAPYLFSPCPYDCGAAVGSTEALGAVSVSGRLRRRDGGVAPCDSSCVHARGPKCDCVCGGENHGGGAVVCLDRFSDHGTPEARFRSAPKSAAEARRRAEEWRALRRELELAAKALAQLRREAWQQQVGRYHVPDSIQERYRAIRTIDSGFFELDDMRTHPRRMVLARRLLELARRLQKEQEAGA